MGTLQSYSTSLIADIGGTHARFALVDSPAGGPFEAKTLNCSEHATLVDAVECYLHGISNPRPRYAAFSIATAVESDH
ncbi:MAG: glucokinase, partial [Gammaproteobacteria bacterium]|nr:glucokinase [Gammaproteobacteria bacterium]